MSATGYDVDPESAGLKRVERPGWAIALTAIGGIASVVSFFLGWFNVEVFRSSGYLAEQGIDSSTPVPSVDKELVTPFEVVDRVKEASGNGLAPYEPGTFGSLVFPWLAVALTVLCILLALVASVGLRSRARSLAARAVGVVIILLTGAVVAGAYFDIGGREERMTYKDGDYTSDVWTSWGVEPDFGSAIWALGLLLLLIGAAAGPRISHLLPDGTRAVGALGPQFGVPAPSAHAGPPGQVGPPGQFTSPAVPTGMPGFFPGPVVRTTPTISAIVSAAVGAVLCFAGYGFLPWGKDTTFSDIGEAAREYGFKDQPFVESYFAWLGWAILALTVVVVGLLVLGRTTTAVKAGVLRPILIILGLAMLASHAWMWVVLADDGAEFEVGAYAVALGLLLTLLAALVPPRTSAHVMLSPQRAWPQSAPMQQHGMQPPAQQPPPQQPSTQQPPAQQPPPQQPHVQQPPAQQPPPQQPHVQQPPQ
ncbi:hypothetical protein ASG90_14005 [Nocardioides sp. Soil797]|nr:hypothetical protein ASG90_14005 [Nocardioides sp. Soil797]